MVIADDLDLEVAEGEALGMLGPNGAGKTTLFGVIGGMIAPNRGTGAVSGPRHDAAVGASSAAGSAWRVRSRSRSRSAA